MQRLGAHLFVLLLTLFPRAATGQIVNRLQVDDATFQRYAWGRMQQYNPANLALADSLGMLGLIQRVPLVLGILGISDEQRDWILTLLMAEKNKVDESLRNGEGEIIL